MRYLIQSHACGTRTIIFCGRRTSDETHIGGFDLIYKGGPVQNPHHAMCPSLLGPPARGGWRVA